MNMFVVHNGIVMTMEEAYKLRQEENDKQKDKLQGYVSDRELYELALSAINCDISRLVSGTLKMESLLLSTVDNSKAREINKCIGDMIKELKGARQKRVYLQEVLDGLG